MKQLTFKELSPEELQWRCPDEYLNFDSTEQLEPIDAIIGQERAVKALQFGVEIKSPGYNIFVSGLSGTGRLTTIKRLLEEISVECFPTPDRCYVYNFKTPDNPKLLEFDQGSGAKFKEDIEAVVRYLRRKIPEILTGDAYTEARNKIIETYEKKEKALLQEFQKKIEEQGFALVPVQVGTVTQPQIFPAYKGKPIMPEELERLAGEGKLTKEEYEQIVKKLQELRKELAQVAKKGSMFAQEMMQKVEEMERESVAVVVESIFEELKSRYKNNAKVTAHIADVQKFTIDNIQIFKQQEEQGPESTLISAIKPDLDPFIVYKVNLLQENTGTGKCPVVIETNPTYTNIFGTIERNIDARGFFQTDHTKIKPGSLLKADGGFLVMNALDALLEPGVWKALKRTLMYNKLEIQPLDSFYQISPIALKPEAINVRVKVILIGDPYIYDILYSSEEDFKKIFKVKADFDSEVKLDRSRIIEYARFVSRICRSENLKHFDKTGVAAVIEQAARFAENQERLWTRFSDIADLIREADYWASKNQHSLVKREDVESAIDALNDRNKLIEEKIQDLIERDILMVSTSGERVGQVNGLSIYDIGYYSFGKPTRITATVGAGKSGITSIEREVNLSGKTHDKGVLTLAGFLRERFAKEKPLSLTASVAFEQSYSGVDGDSASSTELYAILSAISNLPIKQGIAVTGSVNQMGDIQPIGGVNQKIEGFFRVCKARGLTGDQGVIIPSKNAKDLMLNKDVVQAVRDGKFHIYPISRIEEGIEILTGIPAGELTRSGKYKEGTVFNLVEKRLKELASEGKESSVRKKHPSK